VLAVAGHQALVIHSRHSGWRDCAIYGTPILGAFDAIRQLHAVGDLVFVCTSNHCRRHGAPGA